MTFLVVIDWMSICVSIVLTCGEYVCVYEYI